MQSTHSTWKNAMLRAMVVSGFGIALGFVLYQFSIFRPTMRVSQFTFSSITIGMTYAALKVSRQRDGLAALFVWNVVLTGLIEEFNSWLLVLNLAYIAGMAGVTFLHHYVVRRNVVAGAFQRIVLAGAMIAIGNALIAVFLAIISWKVSLSHLGSTMEHVFYNLQIGTLIGLAAGLGMEIAEYLNGKFLEQPEETEGDEPVTISEVKPG